MFFIINRSLTLEILTVHFAASNRKRIIILSIVPSVLALMLLSIFVLLLRKRRKDKDKKGKENTTPIDAEETTGVTFSEIEEQESLARSLDPLQFDFGVIRAATNNFSIENKLGEGGFGPVYKVPTIHSND
eukprot:TRINITY_DN9348_c1_g1_i3.p1 TRINITY_DN9348_c1_g1~~TRINITY_DN9348_c1_g1_i3.p1  ORF type:complete len:131 (-),score=31.53 TRINITY_DN9348_c1_g1_i3:100-492(-)